jgi:hypothetical protein
MLATIVSWRRALSTVSFATTRTRRGGAIVLVRDMVDSFRSMSRTSNRGFFRTPYEWP